jgi:serine/threonine-protein kinase HipA
VRDRLTLLDMVIFSVCIGDTDRHAKNYSLLLDRSGCRLVPLYDAMTSLIYDNVTRNMAMKIADKSRGEYLERRYWERFAQAVGLAPAATVRRVETLAEQLLGWLPEIAEGVGGDVEPRMLNVRLCVGAIRDRTRKVLANCRV